MFEHVLTRVNNVLEEFVELCQDPSTKVLCCYDVNAVIKDVADLIEPAALTAKIDVRFSLSNIQPIRIDAEQIMQAILNIYRNSMQAMPGRGVIDGDFLENGKAAIRISDTGKGISPADISDVFTPFFSTKEDGLGLGLSLSPRLGGGTRGRGILPELK